MKAALLVVALTNALQPPRPARRLSTPRLHAAPAPAWVAGACLTGIAWKPVVTRAMDDWYDNAANGFRRPAWAPPRKWFPPIWRVNYFLIGWAASRKAAVGGLPSIAWAHYALNMCWAPLFFHYRKLRAAFVLNVGLVVTLVMALPSFAEANAALLLAPYLGWLAFATILSLQIARLNPAGVRRPPVWKSKFYGAFVLNHRVVLHAIDAAPARWRGDAGSSPLNGVITVHPTHWLISTQAPANARSADVDRRVAGGL